jgi:DNA-binding CsgD family transcriptional regulator
LKQALAGRPNSGRHTFDSPWMPHGGDAVVEDVGTADPMASALSGGLLAMLATRPRPTPTAIAELAQSACAVDHVALVEIDADVCSVLAAAGPDLLTVGTTSPVAVSSRLVAVAAGQVWSSADLGGQPGFDRPIDQLARVLGIRSGVGVPLTVRGRTAGAVLLSRTTHCQDWSPVVAAVTASAGLFAAALGLGRGVGEPLRVAVVYPDLLVAHGLARVVERGLPADVDVAAGAWDPRLEAIVSNADVIVADSTVGWTGDTDRLVVVQQDPGPLGGNVVLRDDAPTTLVAAVARASSGSGSPGAAAAAPALSARETVLLRELAAGRPYKEIAARLRLSPATVRSYSRGLYAKLGVHSRGEAVAVATRNGLL